MVNKVDRALEQAQERASDLSPQAVDAILKETRASMDVDFSMHIHASAGKRYPIGTRLHLCKGRDSEVVEVATHFMVNQNGTYVVYVKVRRANGTFEDILYHDLVDLSSLAPE